MSCNSCTKSFGSTFVDIVPCSFCGKQFHLECTGIDRTANNSIKKFMNICYFCNGCNDWIINHNISKLWQKVDLAADRAAEALVLKKIEADVAANNKLITEILNKSNHIPDCCSGHQPLIDASDVGGQVFKSSANSINHERDQSKKNTNSPLSFQASHHAHNSGAALHIKPHSERPIIIGTGDLVSSLQVVKPRKTLFVSRLHKDVSEAVIKDYLKDKFNIEDVNCQRIISRRINDADRNFSSFKLYVDVTDFENLLQPSSWPAGSLIKEFVIFNNGRTNKSNFPVLQRNQPTL